MSKKEHVTLAFISRPGVSYSLRAAMDNLGERGRPLFVMIDIIDDDSENRWLSVHEINGSHEIFCHNLMFSPR
jgi:hypothetical protein